MEGLLGVEKQKKEDVTQFESIMDRLNNTLYKIRVLFNHDFISAETVKKKEVKEKMMKLRNEGEISDLFTKTEREEILRVCTKLECLMAAHEFLRENASQAKALVLLKGAEVGWEDLKEEVWREEFVEKAGTCTKLQAREALSKTADLSKAVKMASKITVQSPQFGGKPPSAEAIATMKRLKKSKNKEQN